MCHGSPSLGSREMQRLYTKIGQGTKIYSRHSTNKGLQRQVRVEDESPGLKICHIYRWTDKRRDESIFYL